jgi:voltage-gated potassium channel
LPVTESRLERHDKRTEWPLAAVALSFLALYSLKVLAQTKGPVDGAIKVALLVIYLVFVLDFVVRLPILVLPFLRPLRLLSLAVVINALQRAVGHTIRGRVIIYTACGAVALVYAASLAILEAERDAPVQRVSEEDAASQLATAAQIDALREEMRQLTETVRPYRDEEPDGSRVEGSE